MAKVWDSMTQGGQILSYTAFDESGGFYEDFRGDLTTIFGQSTARESVDGKLKNGMYVQGVNVYWGDSQHDSHAILNNEQQFYRNNLGDDPSPMANYSKSSAGNLLMTGRRSTATEKSTFAHFKGYHVMPDGSQATIADLPNPNQAWAPVREKRSSGADDDNVDVWRFEKYPADFISVMFSSLGRTAMSYFRLACRGKSASGGQVLSETKNYQQIDAWFSALVWALEYIGYGEDINGDALPSGQTHMPGNELAGGVIPEADAHENFSDSVKLAHETMHYYDGVGGMKQSPASIITTADCRSTMITYGVDITPGKIGFWINDTYRYVMTTPPSIANPKPRYVKDPNNEARPLLGGDGLAVTDGIRKNPDGSDYYMKWFFLSNLAVNSNLSRSSVYDYLRNPDPYFTHSVGEWTESASNEIEFIQMYPLAVDNPDLYPVLDTGQPVSAGTPGGTTEEVEVPDGDGGTTTTPTTTPTGGAVPVPLNPRLVIFTQPAMREGRPMQQLIGVPFDGYVTEGKTFTWSSSIPELTFDPQGTRVTTPSVSGLTSDQLATITLDDGEA